MPLDTIEKSDVLSWDSKEDIADTLEKRGLERTSLGKDDEIVMELEEDKFVAIVAATNDTTPSDYNSRMTSTRQTQVVSTDDFEQFTFTTRRRAWDKHGQIKYNRWQIKKEQFRPGGEANTALEKLNNIEHGDAQSINQLYETKKVVNEFYDKFESIRADMVHKVSGIPEGEGEKKQNYAQTIFDRLIFLHFIQEKKLLDYNQDYLEDNHGDVIENGGDVYEDFYKPLFFKWLATDQEHPDDTLPYLNGGLFTETDVEREYEEVRLGEDTEETNKLFTEILDFLGDWNWHADERLDIVDPNRLSPELLGHIFEKTVNQKEMGAYYTPEEITHFMSRNTIQPYILDRINEKFDKDYEEIDELFKIPEEVDEEDEDSVVIGPVDEIEREEIEHLYFEVLQDLKVLDPAVGSGAFLLAAQEVLIDIYMSALRYFQDLDEEASWEMTERIQDVVTELENNAAKTSAEKSMHAKRQIILNNLYGVDIDKGATEICKLRLWLSIVADLEKGDDPHKVETLPNIDFNIRQGNSLIGFTEPIEKALNDDIDDSANQAKYSQFTEDAIYKKYDEIIKKIDTYKEHEREGNGEKAKQARQEAFQKLEEYREKPDEKILQQFHEAGIEDVDMEDIKEFSPFHWVLEFAEVYSEGGFDVIIGNPPWDKVKAERDDFFPQYDEIFRQRSPSEKNSKEEELKSDPEIKSKWKNYKQDIDNLSSYYNENFELQKPKIFGDTQSNEKDLSALFLERIWQISSDEGYVSQILPGVIYQGGSKKDLRKELIENNTVKSFAEFENHGIFDGLHNQYKFGIITAKCSGQTNNIKGNFSKGNSELLRDFNSHANTISTDFISRFSPEALMFPYMESEKQISIISNIIEHTPLSEISDDAWNAIPYRELDRTNDSDRFVEFEEEGDYPVYGGSNIYQFEYNNQITSETEEPEFWSVDEDDDTELSAKRRIREKVYKSRKEDVGLKKSIYVKMDGDETSKSQKGFVNDLLQETRGKDLSLQDVKLDCNWPRIVLRHVTNSTNERTIISSVVPEGIVAHNALTTIRPIKFSNIDEDDLEDFPLEGVYEKAMSTKEMFYLVGFLNSVAFDYLMRTKIEENMVMYKFRESHLPRLTEGDNWFNFISNRAAQLNCYGDEFEQTRQELGIEPVTSKGERKRIQSEIDAASFHAYGLDKDEAKYVLKNFNRVDNPRMMTEDYFDMVLENYDELDEEGPLE